jgi:hypothetical protein
LELLLLLTALTQCVLLLCLCRRLCLCAQNPSSLQPVQQLLALAYHSHCCLELFAHCCCWRRLLALL